MNGDTGKIVDMKEYGLLESAAVKIQTFKTAIEVRIRGYFSSFVPFCSPTITFLFDTLLASWGWLTAFADVMILADENFQRILIDCFPPLTFLDEIQC